MGGAYVTYVGGLLFYAFTNCAAAKMFQASVDFY